MKYLLLGTLIAFAMGSCKKAENKIYYEGGENIVLSSSLANNSFIELENSTKDEVAVRLNWTNPNYKFTTGVSSQNVTYTFQLALSGTNFSSDGLVERTFLSDLSESLTQGDLNKMLIQMGLPFDSESSVDIRVKSSLEGGSVPLYSNVLTFRVLPFLDVLVPLPTTGELYIVGGDPLLGGWANGGDFAVQDQQFTQVDETTFSITIQLSGGDNTQDVNQYLIIPKWGDWAHKYACQSTSAQPTDGGKFGFDAPANFPGPTEAGDYRITVDFLNGVYRVDKL